MNQIQKVILQTLVYADIFDYPLRGEEIWRYLISAKNFSFSALQKELNTPKIPVDSEGQYYFLKGRGDIVRIRNKRLKDSVKKLKIAQRVACWLKLIPTIKMVVITGALAMNNADEDEDIDLLIVAAKDRLWLTRMLTVILVEIVACRRHPGDPPVGGQVRDKICLNMFLDEAHLSVPLEEQNLFIAHEVSQVRLLWDRQGSYQKFISQNLWLKKYLPNWKP